MELRHLRYFVAVAEELHFRRAAERLHVSQPPLSQQVRQLEAEVGAQLLVRDRRRVELTAAGEAFLIEARRVLADADHAAELARRAARGEVGQLAVGFVGSAMYAHVPELLRSFRAERPDVQLQLRELPTVPQLEALAAGQIDVGFIRPPAVAPAPGLRAETIARERAVVALPEGHPLARRRRLRVQDLHGEAFVVLGRRDAPGLHDTLAAALAAGGRTPEIVQEAAEMQTLVGLVAAGLGVALVPASVQALARDGVVYRALVGSPARVELAVAWREDDRSPVVAAFLALARRHRRTTNSAPVTEERGSRRGR